jgi:hypothetical protein
LAIDHGIQFEDPEKECLAFDLGKGFLVVAEEDFEIYTCCHILVPSETMIYHVSRQQETTTEKGVFYLEAKAISDHDLPCVAPSFDLEAALLGERRWQ